MATIGIAVLGEQVVQVEARLTIARRRPVKSVCRSGETYGGKRPLRAPAEQKSGVAVRDGHITCRRVRRWLEAVFIKDDGRMVLFRVVVQVLRFRV